MSAASSRRELIIASSPSVFFLMLLLTLLLSLGLSWSSYHFGCFLSIYLFLSLSFYLSPFPLNIFGRRHPPPLVVVVSTSEQSSGVRGDDVAKRVSLVYFPAELSRAAGNTEEDRTLNRNI